MRILYVDCDSLRPDHLGCYGYHRDTSPTIDRLARQGRRFTNCYASDAPCLPSRTALFTGRLGIHTGVVNHGGINADIRHRGEPRGFNTRDEYRTWMTALGDGGYRTALVSPFPQRHGAWHVLDGFDEWHDTGGNGSERAEVVAPVAEEWLDDHATGDDWYLHVNFWDPHTLYDTPLEYGDPFADDPPPDWPDEETIQEHYGGRGPFSARDLFYYGGKGEDIDPAADARMPDEIASREDFEEFVDGYDTAIRYMDDHIGTLLDALERAGVREDTLIVVSADHGESQGEHNVYGDHLTADASVCRVPLIVHGPGIEPGVDEGLHYHLDVAPTITELVGGDPAAGWDGETFAPSLSDGAEVGREFLVMGHAAWTCQRAVRWDGYILIRTYHDAYMDLDPIALYDLESDPHETTNLARERPGVAREGLALLEQWVSQRLMEAATGEAGGNPESPRAVTDPLFEVLREGGAYHPRGHRERYVERLRETGRAEHAEAVEARRGFVPQNVDAYLAGDEVPE